jgi:phosphoglycolate phosphatase
VNDNRAEAAGAVAPARVATRTFEVSAIAFDLDGTLLDTVHDLAAAVNALLAERGLAPLPAAAIRGMIGKGMPTLVRRALARATGTVPDALGASEVAAALARYQAHYAECLGRETRPFPGLAEALDRLVAMGFPLAVVTNKASRFVRPHLERAAIAHCFAAVVGGDDLPAKKPEPAQLLHVAAKLGVPASRLLMVGDSANDAEAARAAGCPVLLVPYGYNEDRPVQEVDADGIVDSLAAVADCVRYVAPESP